MNYSILQSIKYPSMSQEKSSIYIYISILYQSRSRENESPSSKTLGVTVHERLHPLLIALNPCAEFDIQNISMALRFVSEDSS